MQDPYKWDVVGKGHERAVWWHQISVCLHEGDLQSTKFFFFFCHELILLEKNTLLLLFWHIYYEAKLQKLGRRVTFCQRRPSQCPVGGVFCHLKSQVISNLECFSSSIRKLKKPFLFSVKHKSFALHFPTDAAHIAQTTLVSYTNESPHSARDRFSHSL